jgi:predicted alpha/beta hydrolase family esterase
MTTPRKQAKPKPKRAFIIHGYMSFPGEAWLPWLKRELVKRGYRVKLPAMPTPNRPSRLGWIRFIAKLVGEPDSETVMIGHSLGCQAVIRYLETLGAAGKGVGKTVLVAGNFPPNLSLAEAKAKTGGNAALLPWFTVPVDARKVKKAAGRCTMILSEDDPYIPVKQARATLRAKLNATIIIEHGKGHFNEDDEITRLPAALKAVLA